MGRKYLVRYERGNCIGAGVCVVMDAASFEMNTDGKANLLDGKQSSAYF